MKKLAYAAAALLVAFALAFAFAACSEADDDPAPVKKPTEPTVETWTVTFDPDGGNWSGSTTAKTLTVEKGKSIKEDGKSLPANPTRQGYDFVQWQLGSSKFTEESTISGNITVKAFWEEAEEILPGDVVIAGTVTLTSTGSGAETYRVGKELTVVTTAVTFTKDGAPTDKPGAGMDFHYAWLSDGNIINGQEANKYTITALDAGREITCVVRHDGAKSSVRATTTAVPCEIELEFTRIISGVEDQSVQGDTVTVSPVFGKLGDTITLSYSLVGHKINNLVVFSGIASVQEEPIYTDKDQLKTGTVTFVIEQKDIEDAQDYINKEGKEDKVGKIIVLIEFNHSDKKIETLAFPNNDGPISKTYGDGKFTNEAHTAAGSAYETTRPIVYSISPITDGGLDTGVATVNSTTGEVTIVKTGSVKIRATKAANDDYEEGWADYTLSVAKKQLTISGTEVTKTKPSDGNTVAAVTKVGTLAGIEFNETVGVTAEANYNSAVADTNKKITVVFSLVGAASVIFNYEPPVDIIYEDGVITELLWTIQFNSDGGDPASYSVGVNQGTNVTIGVDKFPADPIKEYANFAGWYLSDDTGFTGTKYDKDTVITGNTALKAKWISTDARLQPVTFTVDGSHQTPTGGGIEFTHPSLSPGRTSSIGTPAATAAAATAGDVLLSIFPDAQGSGTTFTALRINAKATVEYAAAVGSDIPASYSSSGLVKFSDSFSAIKYLYVKVVAEDGTTTLFYKIKVSFDEKAIILYGTPTIAEGVVDTKWDDVSIVYDVNKVSPGSTAVATYGQAKALWDEDGLYLFVVVADDTGVTTNTTVTSGQEHNYDSVELFINERVDANGNVVKNMSSNTGGSETLDTGTTVSNNIYGKGGQYRLDANTGTRSGDPALAAFNALNKSTAFKIDGNHPYALEGKPGYIVIFQAPWRFSTSSTGADVGAPWPVKNGKKIGFEIQINACTGAGGTGTSREGTLIWNNTTSNTNWRNVRWFGEAELQDRVEYTITLDADGGTGVPATVVTGRGGKLTSLPTPTLDGNRFDGWFLESDFTTQVDLNTVFTGNAIIYAKWTELPFVNLDLGGVEVTPAMTKLTLNDDGTPTSLPTPKTTEKKTFVGWFEEDDFTTAVTLSSTLVAGETIYAQWDNGVYFYVDLSRRFTGGAANPGQAISNVTDQNQSAFNTPPTVVTESDGSLKATYNSTTNSNGNGNQSLCFSLTTDQITLLRSKFGSTVRVILDAETTVPEWTFRYVFGNPRSNTNWNFSDAAGAAGTIAEILDKTINLNANNSELNASGFILQKRSMTAGDVVVTIRSIKIIIDAAD